MTTSYIGRRDSVSRRKEGERLLASDIKVGDEILVTRTTAGIAHTRQGVVTEVTKHSNFGEVNWVIKAGTAAYGQRLNWGKDYPETYTLVKAAPEIDALQQKLDRSFVGQVIRFGEWVGVKNRELNWDIHNKSRFEVRSTPDLRSDIGNLNVTFLKGES